MNKDKSDIIWHPCIIGNKPIVLIKDNSSITISFMVDVFKP
jgi:hypothetical protein